MSENGDPNIEEQQEEQQEEEEPKNILKPE